MKKEEWAPIYELFNTEEFQKDSKTNQINPALMYKKTHTNKDDTWTSDTTREYFENMEALQLQHEFEGRSLTEVEIDPHKCLGDESGLCAWFRHSVRQVGSSSYMSIDLTRKIGRGKNGDRGDEG
ncbi:hypothetical protein CJ030_MR4G009605 [Morella rubra]|uniref:Uncharacterized protein n=1 Tax=Morella rubra TaxID=262757 RepID=A0A6A1VT12_9ROSI|nr:hypothetical protein CJ030_MR4G009605 [Morella rubra]